jgi:hypothetical protein
MKFSISTFVAQTTNRIFIFNLLIAYLFLILGLNLHIHVSESYESGAYVSYMKSVVDDGDLNIINNISPGLGWIISKNYNFPDMHDHGSSLLWAPLYAFASILDKIVKLSPIYLQGSPIPVSFDIVVVFIMNAFFGLLGLKIIRHLVTRTFSLTPPLWSMALIIFGTGFFNFLMYQFSSADISFFFYASLVTYFMSFIDNQWKSIDYFLLGSLFAFGSVIKITFPLLIPVYFYFYFANKKITFFDFLKNNFVFLIGMSAIHFLKEVNNLIKFGFNNLDQGYSYAYSFENLLSPIPHTRPFLGPAGLFTVSPISFFASLAFFVFLYVLIKRKFKVSKEIVFFLAAGLSIMAKHYLSLTAIFDGYAGFGFRQYMVDTIVIYLLIAIIYNKRFEYKKIYRISLLIFFLCLIWTIVENLWWLEVTTYRHPSFNAYFIQDYSLILKQLNRMLENLLALFNNSPSHLFKNIYYIFLLIIPVWIWTNSNYFFLHGNPEKIKIFFKYTSISIIFFYLSITAMNFYFNPKNVATMKAQNYFSQKVMGNGKEIFLYDEYISSITYAMEIAKYNKDPEWFEYQKKILVRLLNLTKTQIIKDPINFKTHLEIGNLKNLEVDYHSQDFNNILDYNSPVTFKTWKNK